MSYTHSTQADVEVATSAERLFDYMDDQANPGSHMQRSSAMMLWGSMAYDFDEARGRSVGSVIKMTGKVAGLKLYVEEVVIQRQPPFLKAWETVGVPRLLVIGSYRMRFQIEDSGRLCRLHVFIDYNYPTSVVGWIAGTLLGAAYARWCVERMAAAAKAEFSAKLGPD